MPNEVNFVDEDLDNSKVGLVKRLKSMNPGDRSD
jgi:hypothetical protein